MERRDYSPYRRWQQGFIVEIIALALAAIALASIALVSGTLSR